jgi:hypothetical protein
MRHAGSLQDDFGTKIWDRFLLAHSKLVYIAPPARLCWIKTQQTLLRLPDAQSLYRRAIDLAGHRQVIN